jgi:hypothetical protein
MFFSYIITLVVKHKAVKNEENNFDGYGCNCKMSTGVYAEQVKPKAKETITQKSNQDFAELKAEIQKKNEKQKALGYYKARIVKQKM